MEHQSNIIELKHIKKQFSDNGFVAVGYISFITFGRDGLVTDQRRGVNTADPIDCPLQLHSNGTRGNRSHCLEAAWPAIAEEVFVDVKGNHGQALIRLRELHE